MKRVLVLSLVIVALLVFTGDALGIGIFGSYWHGEETDTGYGLGIKHKFNVITLISVDIRASWLSFKDEGETDLNLYPLEATALAKLGPVYGGLGAGYYIFDAKNADADNSTGWFILVGGEITAGGIGLFGEFKWTFLDTKIEDINVNADGFGINAGILLFW